MTNIPVLLFIIRCIFFFTVKTGFVYALRKEYTLHFFPFCQSFSVEASYLAYLAYLA